MQKHQRSVVSMAVMAALASGAAQAVSDKLEISGFGDITYMVTDDTTPKDANNKSPTEGKFGASAEVDFVGKLADNVTVRVDADLDLVTNGGANVASSDSGRIEQALFAFAATDKFTLLGGVFNNPIGWEKEDAPDMYQTTHGQIWAILDGQTALHGNNVAGVAGAINLGQATVTVGLLNDLAQANEENSTAIAVNYSPMPGLDLEAGYVTQATSAEDWYDLNATYKKDALTLGAEYFAADKVVDSAYGLYANYSFPNGFGITGRFDSVSYGEPVATRKDTETATIAGSYAIAKNLSVVAEYRTQDDPNDTDGVPGAGINGVIGDGDLVQLEFIATF